MTQAAQPSLQALEKKRRLGHYAVIWKDGQPVREGGESAATQSSLIVALPQ